MGPDSTMLKSSKPVISICATRTGCGKSQTTRKVMQILKAAGKASRRHPPRHALRQSRQTEIATVCRSGRSQKTRLHHRGDGGIRTLHRHGRSRVRGVDYEAILREAEQEAEIILWDGGNNDLPFYVSDLEIVVTDPHRAGHETRYHPGETNLRRAQVVIINKMDTAEVAEVDKLRHTITKPIPKATVIEAASPITVEGHEQIKGKRVLVIEDGPTLTHGEMPYGAG